MPPKKRIRDRGPLESAIQTKICERMASMGLFFWRCNNIPVSTTTPGGFVKFRALPKFTPRGLPDIILVYGSTVVGIEVKRPGMTLRPEQADFGQKLLDNGGLYWVLHSVEELESRLAILGV